MKLQHLPSGIPTSLVCRALWAYRSARYHTRITPTVSKLASNVQEVLVKEILGHNSKVILDTAPKCIPELTFQIKHT
jgi:hypothetical protein